MNSPDTATVTFGGNPAPAAQVTPIGSPNSTRPLFATPAAESTDDEVSDNIFPYLTDTQMSTPKNRITPNRSSTDEDSFVVEARGDVSQPHSDQEIITVHDHLNESMQNALASRQSSQSDRSGLQSRGF